MLILRSASPTVALAICTARRSAARRGTCVACLRVRIIPTTPGPRTDRAGLPGSAEHRLAHGDVRRCSEDLPVGSSIKVWIFLDEENCRRRHWSACPRS